MDEITLQTEKASAIRSFRICLDRPQQPTTILGVVRRAAAEQAKSGVAGRSSALPRRFSAFV